MKIPSLRLGAPSLSLGLHLTIMSSGGPLGSPRPGQDPPLRSVRTSPSRLQALATGGKWILNGLWLLSCLPAPTNPQGGKHFSASFTTLSPTPSTVPGTGQAYGKHLWQEGGRQGRATQPQGPRVESAFSYASSWDVTTLLSWGQPSLCRSQAPFSLEAHLGIFLFLSKPAQRQKEAHPYQHLVWPLVTILAALRGGHHSAPCSR